MFYCNEFVGAKTIETTQVNGGDDLIGVIFVGLVLDDIFDWPGSQLDRWSYEMVEKNY